MKIKRMSATFGKLEQAELILTDGLNVIHQATIFVLVHNDNNLATMLIVVSTNAVIKGGAAVELVEVEGCQLIFADSHMSQLLALKL